MIHLKKDFYIFCDHRTLGAWSVSIHVELKYLIGSSKPIILKDISRKELLTVS